MSVHLLLFLTMAIRCRGTKLQHLAMRIANANFGEALKLVGNEKHNQEFAHTGLVHVAAELHLLQGNLEEAEESFRTSMKAIPIDRPDRDGWACRAAGLQALFRNRIETAATCFHRLVEGEFAIDLRLEAQALLAEIFFEAGLLARAQGLVESIAAIAEQEGLVAWHRLAHLLVQEFHWRALLHSFPEAHDDIFWQSIDEPLSLDVAALPTLSADASPGEDVVISLIDSRLEVIGLLRALAMGQRGDHDLLRAKTAQAKRFSRTQHVTAVLEMAMGAIVSHQTQLAAALLEECCAPHASEMVAAAENPNALLRRHLYCLTKLRLQQGRLEDGIALYPRYALVAMHGMRAAYALAKRFSPGHASEYSLVNDEISARLPAKYRRAYHYMLAHVHVYRLAVSEIAAAVGVTERALQIAFRKHLGISPSEVLRRHRMACIREELQAAQGGKVMEIASKFGVQNRSTLTAGYRKYFSEAVSVAAPT
jgi:AraC-like DNA-binding protein